MVSLVWTSIAKLYENSVFVYLDKCCEACKKQSVLANFRQFEQN